MRTHASSTILQYAMLTVNSVVFSIGMWICWDAVIKWIGRGVPDFVDRFPSVGSGPVLLLFGLLILGTSSLGITAVHFNDSALLHTFGYVSFIACFVKFLFLVATTQMHAFNYSYNPFSASVLLCIIVAILEVALGMCSCHLAKLLKRGDPELEIPTLPADQRRRKSQSSQSVA